MKTVVDTNVVACLLLRTEQFVDEARTFMRMVEEAHAPALWEAELGNVLWMATRHNILIATVDAALIKAFPNVAARPAALITN